MALLLRSASQNFLVHVTQQGRELLERLKRMDAFDTQNFDSTVSMNFINSAACAKVCEGLLR